MKFLPVFIIGAPRSGTNMLRDVLVQLPGVKTWPCDEINFIWRHKNVFYASDEFPKTLATQSVKTFVRNYFLKAHKKYKAKVLVEKTCANSLRIGFVNEIIPNAKYIFIVRDGIDAANSAQIRWKAKLNYKYVFDKAKFIPLFDLPIYFASYFWARIHKLYSKDKRLAFWGPKIEGMNKLLETKTLDEVCAIQWQRCVELASQELSKLQTDFVLHVKYEDFVKNPKEELIKIIHFLNIDLTEINIDQLVKNISSKSLGKGRNNYTKAQLDNLEELIGSTLTKFGYPIK
jgi:hypothetical protein